MSLRLQVYLAHAGIASRRSGEKMITEGRVSVNGKIIKEMGVIINPDKDKILVDGKPIFVQTNKMTFVLNKPVGIISSVSDPDGKRTVIDYFSVWWKKQNTTPVPRLYPVGRLDEQSEGLMLLTNDGDFAYKMTHPKFKIEKKYQVLLQGAPTNTQLNALKKGVKLKEGFSCIDDLQILRHDEGNTWIEITIHQGLHRQVRRTVAQVGLTLLRLVRTSMGEYQLDNLAIGQIKLL